MTHVAKFGAVTRLWEMIVSKGLDTTVVPGARGFHGPKFWNHPPTHTNDAQQPTFAP